MLSDVVFPRPVVDANAFANTTARLAGAAAIVAWGSDDPRGLLVRAVSLLSTRPPRVLFGVAKDEPGHEALLSAETCSLNLLGAGDEAEAERWFRSQALQEPLGQERWRLQSGQPPRLEASAAYLAGFIDQRIDAGSHSLFVVRVEIAETKDRAPLVYFDHGFRRLEPARQSGGAQVCAMLEA